MGDNSTQPVATLDPEVSLFAYLEILWRYKYLIVALMLGAVLLAYFTVSRAKATYQATSAIQVGITQVGPLSTVDFYREVLEAHAVLAALEHETGIAERKLAQRLKVEPIGANGLLRLSVTGESPKDAEALGDAWFNAFYVEAITLWKDVLTRQVALYPPSNPPIKQTNVNPGFLAAAAEESSRLQRMRENLRHGRVDDIMVVSPFSSPSAPVVRRKSLFILIAGLMAFFAGASVAVGFESWRAYSLGRGVGKHA